MTWNSRACYYDHVKIPAYYHNTEQRKRGIARSCIKSRTLARIICFGHIHTPNFRSWLVAGGGPRCIQTGALTRFKIVIPPWWIFVVVSIPPPNLFTICTFISQPAPICKPLGRWWFPQGREPNAMKRIINISRVFGKCVMCVRYAPSEGLSDGQTKPVLGGFYLPTIFTK